jgi:hypothetical protein
LTVVMSSVIAPPPSHATDPLTVSTSPSTEVFVARRIEPLTVPTSPSTLTFSAILIEPLT